MVACRYAHVVVPAAALFSREAWLARRVVRDAVISTWPAMLTTLINLDINLWSEYHEFVTLVLILCLPRISTQLLEWLAGISGFDLICRENSDPAKFGSV